MDNELPRKSKAHGVWTCYHIHPSHIKYDGQCWASYTSGQFDFLP